ncbi:MAG: DUF86 domain-containing protein [Candidatus Methanoperedens sp.]|nr:DUF86 domain-containing protein [Candidatus Methanoperedens sp.]MCZ7360654.1 DUF86 domain-containing protein [Candidatus Methanoperedens sp.]
MRTEIIRTKIAEIEESLKMIRDNLPPGFDEFRSLGLIKDGMHKRIEFCIENVFDICAIINTDLKLGIPQSDDDILEIMVRKGIIDQEIQSNLKLMKGFRNIIVHRYGRIDDRLSYEFLSERLEDFDKFIMIIRDYLRK